MGDEKKTNPSDPIDAREYLQITVHPNGSITRGLIFPQIPPSSNPTTNTSATLSKDLPINPQKATWARLYLPKTALNNPDYYQKLPLIVYFHGGGFILSYVDSQFNHEFCEHLPETTPALVISVEYRIAPEHRLPAAYDDAAESLSWIRNSLSAPPDDDVDNWIAKYGDPSSCFLMGTSAGGNIAYHVGLRAATGLGPGLGPMRIRGLILHGPFFGGEDRTESEMRLVNNPYLPVSVADFMWEFALPEGADRDHEYSNPVKGGGSGQLDKVRELGWKVLLTGCSGDPLIDRQVEVAKVMEGRGISLVTHVTEGGYHGVEMLDPTKTSAYIELVMDFIVKVLNPM